MDNLLALAVDAHGGLDLRNKFDSLHANVSIGGALWDMKRIPGIFANARLDLKLREQRVVIHLPPGTASENCRTCWREASAGAVVDCAKANLPSLMRCG